MSGTGIQTAPLPVAGAQPRSRSPLAHLLHALNQPLTGLQCSLELAATDRRSTEQYVRIVRESLELTGRMRILVEAIRELGDNEDSDAQDAEPFAFDAMLRENVESLLPVAESHGVRLALVCSTALPMRANRLRTATLIFRSLECALSLARAGSDLQITGISEAEHTRLVVRWKPGAPPEHSPFSRQELGLIIAQAGWERAGAEWVLARAENSQSYTVRFPLAFPSTAR